MISHFRLRPFYRTMHVVLALHAVHGVAIVGIPVSRPSDCLSVTLMYREHIGWTSSKLIKRIISLIQPLLREVTTSASASAIYFKGNTPKIRVE